MAFTEFYMNTELATGLDDGTSEANAWKTWASAVAGWTTNDSRLNVKNPSSRQVVDLTATFTITTLGLLPAVMRGYGSTIGDGVSAQYEGLSLIFSGSSSGVRCQEMDLLDANPAAATNQMFDAGAVGGVCFYNCKGVRTSANNPTTARVFDGGTGGEIINCYASCEWSPLISSLDGVMDVVDGTICYNIVKMTCPTGDWGTNTTNPTAIVVRAGSSGAEDGGCAHRNLVYIPQATQQGHLTHGIDMKFKGNSGTTSSSAAGSLCCTFNTIVNFHTGIYWNRMGSGSSANVDCNFANLIAGCKFSVWTHGDNTAAQNPAHSVVGCAFDGIICGNATPILNRRFSVDPFTDSANDDYSLNSTEGGGLVARASALTATGGTPDIGAIQS